MTKAKQTKTMNAPRYGSIVPSKKRGSYNTSRFANVADPIVASVYSSPQVMYPFTTDASGNTNAGITLTTTGITTLDSFGTGKQIVVPHLPWLYTASSNFSKFRVLGATLVVVGNVGSAVTGKVAIHTSTDINDLGQTLPTISTGGDMFELAGLASRSRRIRMNVNSNWKQVTSSTMRGTIVDSSVQLTPTSTMDDLLFSVISLTVAGGPASQSVLSLYVEYDVEFANPIAIAMNG